MPFEIAIDPSRRRISTRASGQITGEDLKRYYRALYAHPDFEPDMSEVFDLTDATAPRVRADDIRAFSLCTAVNTCKGGGVRVAIVAPDDLTFGMARMYQLLQLRTTNTLKLFRSRADADRWLDECVEPA